MKLFYPNMLHCALAMRKMLWEHVKCVNLQIVGWVSCPPVYISGRAGYPPHKKLFKYSNSLKCAIILCCVLAPNTVNGQIVPNTTLPVNSTVNKSGNTFVINGGTQAGGNLFHSFERFDVPTGTQAWFNNAPTIENIFTRVTGGSISNIDGILRANGSANLFLINPSGIIFGPNASLNIGGSFIGSSAMSINFADGTQFSTKPNSTPLLTISVPVGLGLGSNPGAIQVQGTGGNESLPNILSPYIGVGASSTGLQVQPGKTLALIGGDITLVGGILTASQGRIELGSGATGVVSLSPSGQGWTLGYDGVPSFRDIRLSQRALVDASGSGGGAIQVQGAHVILADGSIMLIQNQGFNPAGDIRVNASESLELIGTTTDESIPSSLRSETVGIGNSGDIAVSTKRLVLQNGGNINNITYGIGSGGNIAVNASESIQLFGLSPVTQRQSSSMSTTTFGSGHGGNFTLSTRQLSNLDGGTIAATTFGSGSAGDMTVNATDSVEAIGVAPGSLQPSTLTSSTVSTGNAGSLTVNTQRLSVQDGGRIDSSTVASGAAGSVTVNAQESVEVSGTGPGSRNPSLIVSSATIVDKALQQYYGLPSVPSGASGDVTINTNVLNVINGGIVNVSNEGIGNAGTARINAGSIVLDHNGGITAATAAGVGGNIFLRSQDLRLRNNSSISATAGGTVGNGGNITINTGTLLALENSDITANAQYGFGGRVTINAKGIFGTQYRITASSSKGADFNGVVQINTADVDPSVAVVALPATVLDPSHQITARCAAQKGNNFVVTGRGGLPSDPTATLRGTTLWSDLRRVGGDGETRETRERDASLSSLSPSSPPTSPTPIIEATGWVIDEHGLVELVAQGKESSQHQPWQKTPACGEI